MDSVHNSGLNIREKTWLLYEKYDGTETDAYRADCARLDAGEPLAYIIGTIPFLNVTVHLDSHPLIPRPETEHWTFKVIGEMHGRDADTPLRVLDLCAGSGCIGVAVLAAVPNAQVDFVEIDAAHHATITKNIEANSIDPTRTHIIGGDLFEHAVGPYDFILTNPPYIDPALRERVAPSVTEHEPAQALFGGQGGMEIIARIIADAPQHLAPGSILYIEHEPEQAVAIADAARGMYATCGTHEDQYGIFRYTRLAR